MTFLIKREFLSSDKKIFCGTINGNINVMIPEIFVLNEDFIDKKEWRVA